MRPGALVVVVLAAGLAAAPRAAARSGGLGRKPLMGWNTWCTENSCGVDWCTSAEVLDVAQTIKQLGMQDLGYDHINLDDCWGVRNAETHQIEGDPTRFPEGMKSFIAKLHAMGFKFGLYTDIGTEACHHPFVGSYGHYKQDAETFAGWDVDFVKFDGCDQPKGFTAEDLTCQMSDAMNATGRDMWLNFHCWHTASCGTCGNSYRVFQDHHDDFEGSTANVIDFLAHSRQPFWGENPSRGWPDPDFIFTGGQGCGQHSKPGQRCPGQSEAEYVTEMSVWAIAGGQIVFATDPRNMTAFMKSVLFNTEVIAVFNDTTYFGDIVMVPDNSTGGADRANVDEAERRDVRHVHDTCSVSLTTQLSHAACATGQDFGCYAGNNSMWTDNGCRGVFTCNGAKNVQCNQDGSGLHVCSCVPAPPKPGYVFLRPLAGDKCTAAVLYNPDDTAARDVAVEFSDVPVLKWTSSTAVSVRNLWTHAAAGTAVGSFTASKLAPHASMFVTLCL